MTQKVDIWMPLYVAEWDLSTGHLTNEQDGAYGRLVRWYWRNGGPLPNDDEALASIVRVDVKTWRKSLRPKLSPFFSISDGLWRHSRVDAVIDEWVGRRAKAAAKAAAAAKVRWKDHAPGDAPSTKQAMLKDCPKPTPTEVEAPHRASTLSGREAPILPHEGQSGLAPVQKPTNKAERVATARAALDSLGIKRKGRA